MSRTTGISRNTVKKYLLQFLSLGLTVEQVDTMNDRQLATAFLIVTPKIESSRVADLEALLPELADKLRKRSISKQMVHTYYISQCPDGYKSSAFLVRLNMYMGMSKPSMRVPHKVGDKLFVDFTGQKLHDFTDY